MAKRIGFLALGGHIATQNATFRKIMEMLFERKYEFYGLENGFEAFDTGNAYLLTPYLLDPHYAGFYAGSTRASILDRKGKPNSEKADKAVEFVKALNLDYLVASCGDDHGLQMAVLSDIFEDKKVRCKVLVANKTMDGDKGGKDLVEIDGYFAPFAHTTNGFHTAIEVGTRMINCYYSGAWTNETVTLAVHFGRDANWVNAALAWYSNADMAIYGELQDKHPGHSIDKIAGLIHKNMEENKNRFGRAFATVVISEGTRIQGIEHVSNAMQDVHGNKKLNPEILVMDLKEALAKYSIKSQTLTITYAMRNYPASETDLRLARMTGTCISQAIMDGMSGMEAVIKFEDGDVTSELIPAHLASQKRYVRYYPKPFYNADTFAPLPEIGDYFKPILGRKILEKGDLVPRKKPKIVNAYQKR